MVSRNQSELAELRNDDSLARGITALATLARGRKHTRPGKIPDTEIDFMWRVLGGRQKQECIALACARFDELGIPKELRTYTDLEDEQRWQVIAAAMREPDIKGTDSDPYPQPLGTPDEIREALTIDERDILFSDYLDLEELVDPDPVKMPEQWHDDITAALKKSQHDRDESVRILSNLGLRTLIGWCITMVAPRLSLLTGNSDSSLGTGSSTKNPSNPKTQSESEKL